jgi:hypothetical protein
MLIELLLAATLDAPAPKPKPTPRPVPVVSPVPFDLPPVDVPGEPQPDSSVAGRGVALPPPTVVVVKCECVEARPWWRRAFRWTRRKLHL